MKQVSNHRSAFTGDASCRLAGGNIRISLQTKVVLPVVTFNTDASCLLTLDPE